MFGGPIVTYMLYNSVLTTKGLIKDWADAFDKSTTKYYV